MKNILFLSFVIILFFSCKSEKKKEINPIQETTVYYLIRHAEKDRKTLGQDPGLTEIGIERAANWANIFNSINFDQIYSTDYKRTQQTAFPTAAKKGLKIQSYDPDNLYADSFKRRTKGKSVLIVGHSNTTPTFVNTIIGKQKYDQIDDKDNGKLFKVTLTKKDTLVVIEDYN